MSSSSGEPAGAVVPTAPKGLVGAFAPEPRMLGYAADMEPLVDGWGREIRSVRVSVTDKCNFRCTYCMPAEGLTWLPKPEILSFEEIARLVGILARMGVSEVRLTGGEPLVRRDLPDLVRMLADIPGVEDLSLTTNGVLLDRP